MCVTTGEHDQFVTRVELTRAAHLTALAQRILTRMRAATPS
ncbi:hypothetical protein ACH4UT_32735 [Streptomyces sp. NPDC020799]